MTLRRNVGSSRSVLASSSVPARTRCVAGATKSSGSSDCATSPSWHQQPVNVANKPRPAGIFVLWIGGSRSSEDRPSQTTGRDFRGRRARAARPVAFGARPARVPAAARTAAGQSVRRRSVRGRASRAGCCSTRNAPRHRGRSRARSPCSILPYSLLGPFAGALLDRWDRRLVLVGANIGRLLLVLVVAALLAAGARAIRRSWSPR